MIEQLLREHYQQILVNPIANRLRHFITPNQITLLSGMLGVFIFPALMIHQEILAICLLLLSGYCDTLDGTLARNN